MSEQGWKMMEKALFEAVLCDFIAGCLTVKSSACSLKLIRRKDTYTLYTVSSTYNPRSIVTTLTSTGHENGTIQVS